jgi:hypothetical protein
MKKYYSALPAVFIAMFISSVLRAGTFTVESGDYRLEFSKKLCYTICRIFYKDYEIGTRSGYYGTVMAPGSGKYIGAGHKEGGREKVLWSSLTCDGKVFNFTSNKSKPVTGNKIIIEKISRFDQSLFRIRLELTPFGLVEQKRFIALGEQKFKLLYTNLFCWNKLTTNWFALNADGTEESGVFTGKKVSWHLQREIRWTAIYDIKAQKGVILYYPAIIKGAIRKACYWEVPRAYNKFYMMTQVPGQCPKGWKSPVYTVIMRGFSASNVKECSVVLNKENSFLKTFSVQPLKLPTLKGF